MVTVGARPPRVLHLIHWMNRGGIESWLLAVLRQLPRTECRIDVCCKGPATGSLAADVEETGARLLRCPLRPTVWPFVVRLTRILQQHEYDLLHVHTDVHSGPAVFAAKSAGVPAVTTFHNTRFQPETALTRCFAVRTLRSWYGRRSMRYALAQSDRATGVSQGVLRAVETVAEYGRRDLQVLHLGVPEPPVLAAKQLARYRSELQLGGAARVLLHVGSFTERKNHRALLDMFRLVLGRCPNAVLLLVGDGPLRNAITAQIRALGLASRVHLLGVRSDATALMQVSHVLALPSINEGLSLVLMEASATRLPIVASDIPGNREATNNGVAARLHAVHDLNGMAASTVELLRNPLTARRLAGLARQEYDKSFSINAAVRRLMKLYNDVLRLSG